MMMFEWLRSKVCENCRDHWVDAGLSGSDHLLAMVFVGSLVGALSGSSHDELFVKCDALL